MPTLEARRRYLSGIILLLIVVFLWTASNFVTQDIYEDGYEKPFLITYLNTSTFVLYLIPWIAEVLTRRHVPDVGKPTTQGYIPVENFDILNNTTDELQSSPDAVDVLGEPLDSSVSLPIDSCPEQLDGPLTTYETAKLASTFCFFWFLANWSINLSLGYTSVASSTILSSTSGFFTLAVGRLFNVESLTYAKIYALSMSFAGVVLVSLSDSSVDASLSQTTFEFAIAPSTRSIIGDAFALLGSIFYALYVILLKVRVREEERLDMRLFFGFVGLFNIIFLFPLGVLLHVTGLEVLAFPHSHRAWTALVINMLITLSSDYIYVLAMLKTSPLVVTIGLSLTIPLAIIGDYILHKPSTLQALIGATFVISGFVTIGLENSRTVTTSVRNSNAQS